MPLPEWAAALDHELRNDAMKRQSVEKRPLGLLSRLGVGEFLGAFREADEILDGLGRLFFKEAADDLALRSFQNGVCSRRACQSWLLSGDDPAWYDFELRGIIS